ncbi:hypothetical protein GPALN_013358 [Globodera pallida]|nr:hypothetical protein GPALN_013358 [Globodera pallida]
MVVQVPTGNIFARPPFASALGSVYVPTAFNIWLIALSSLLRSQTFPLTDMSSIRHRLASSLMPRDQNYTQPSFCNIRHAHQRELAMEQMEIRNETLRTQQLVVKQKLWAVARKTTDAVLFQFYSNLVHALRQSSSQPDAF